MIDVYRVATDFVSFFQKTIRYLRRSKFRNYIAGQYLRGEGIEIGALHDPLRVPRSAKVWYLDRMTKKDLYNQYRDLKNRKLVDVDIIADGQELSPIENNSQDFVIANHFIEHCEDPIKMLKNAFRVLKSNGILYLSVPDQRYGFDTARKPVSIDHLEKDHALGADQSRRDHFREWASLVDNIKDEKKIIERIQVLIKKNYSIHFHVWTQKEFIEFISFMRQKISFEMELFLKNVNEMILILRKNSE